MRQIEKNKPQEKLYQAQVKVLIEITKHHFMEEEVEIFPEAQIVLKGELERLGEQMEALEKQGRKQ